MKKEHQATLFVLGIAIALLLLALYVNREAQEAIQKAPQASLADPPIITIHHSDGWKTSVICTVGVNPDPSKISLDKRLGIASCPHDLVGIVQEKPQQ